MSSISLRIVALLVSLGGFKQKTFPYTLWLVLSVLLSRLMENRSEAYLLQQLDQPNLPKHLMLRGLYDFENSFTKFRDGIAVALDLRILGHYYATFERCMLGKNHSEEDVREDLEILKKDFHFKLIQTLECCYSKEWEVLEIIMYLQLNLLIANTKTLWLHFRA